MISGVFYAKSSSRQEPATLEVHGGTLLIQIDSESSTFPISECQILPAIGVTSRTIDLPDGSRFETEDLQGFQRIFPGHSIDRWIDRFDSNWHVAIGFLVGTIAIVVLGYLYALPLLAQQIAHKLPQSALHHIESATLSQLEKLWELNEVSPSELKAEWLPPLLAKMKENYPNSKIRFVSGSKIGANAFALPAGTVLVTDKLVRIVESSSELEAVLLHEMGHVEHRHGVQMVVQQAGLYAFLSLVIGISDYSNLPLVLASSSYSRQHELEADRFAAQRLPKDKVLHLITALRKIERSEGHTETSLCGIFSTHPLTQEREHHLKHYSE